MTEFGTKYRAAAPDAIAPDGAEVRLLGVTSFGGMATFTLRPDTVSRAVVHRSVEEIWYIVSGVGRMWRRYGEREEITELAAGVSITIPTGTAFQFRCDGAEPLEAVAVTMPPWPGDAEAVAVAGAWPATR